MKKLLLTGLFILAIYGIGISDSQAVTINFDEYEKPGYFETYLKNYANGDFVIYDNYNVDYSFFAPEQENKYGFYFGSASLSAYYSNAAITLTSATQSLFTINSIDLHSISYQTPTINFYGYDVNGIEVGHQAFTFDSSKWYTLNFNSDFRDIAFLKWQQTTPMHFFDNIVLNKVAPEPVSFLLFGLGGLTLAGGRIIKKKRKFIK